MALTQVHTETGWATQHCVVSGGAEDYVVALRARSAIAWNVREYGVNRRLATLGLDTDTTIRTLWFRLWFGQFGNPPCCAMKLDGHAASVNSSGIGGVYVYSVVDHPYSVAARGAAHMALQHCVGVWPQWAVVCRGDRPAGLAVVIAHCLFSTLDKAENCDSVCS